MTGMPRVRRAISRRHLLCLVGGTLTAASLASACALVPQAKRPPGGPGTPGRIRLGFTSSVTGVQASESTEQTRGLELWAGAVNALGGITVGSQKLPIELKSYDDESRSERVQQYYQRLIEDDRVDFLVSPYSSVLGGASAVVSEQFGKTNILAGVAADSTFTRGYRHVFQVYGPASQFLLGSLDMLTKADPAARRVAIIHKKDPFPAEASSAASEYAKQQGFDLVLYESYEPDTTDFGPLLVRLATAQPDAILGGGHFADSSSFARQIADTQIKVKLLSLLVAPGVPEFAQQLGDAAAGVVAPSQWEPQVSYSAQSARALNIPYFGPTVKEFLTKYRQKHGYDPGYHAANGYAAGLILEQAITEAGSIEQEPVEAALKRMDLMTFYGRIKFDTEKHFGLQVGHEMVYLQWQKGAYKLDREIVWPQVQASAGLVYPKP